MTGSGAMDDSDAARQEMDEIEAAKRILACLDLTDLSDDSTAERVEALCDRARSPHGPVAAVCVWPRFVATARAALGQGPVRVATVVNFPGGDAPAGDVLDEVEAAIAAGADEIDLVVPWKGLIEGDDEPVRALVERVRAAAGAPVKAILETGMLNTEALIRRAAQLAIAGGADFLKTSTGKVPVNATLRAAEILLDEIARADRPVGFKAAGGIRTLDDARGYLDLACARFGPDWALPASFRIGASGLYDALIATLDGAEVPRIAGGY
ncbi:MAG: deoxyribose-phosphate aldolase [Alphaproteobacteria bacterium]|nr:MAG: deoxyribose-phosphate aldolase [Alphaproteobacteria bacterium]